MSHNLTVVTTEFMAYKQSQLILKIEGTTRVTLGLHISVSFWDNIMHALKRH